jgi:hypothetical protein
MAAVPITITGAMSTVDRAKNNRVAISSGRHAIAAATSTMTVHLSSASVTTCRISSGAR